ncbi:PEP-utilizing enzyme, partial [Acinetobacter baumannii]
MPDQAILVARTTNPAWTPLFYKAKGLITESGGPLSHGAVTARE